MQSWIWSPKVRLTEMFFYLASWMLQLSIGIVRKKNIRRKFLSSSRRDLLLASGERRWRLVIGVEINIKKKKACVYVWIKCVNVCVWVCIDVLLCRRASIQLTELTKKRACVTFLHFRNSLSGPLILIYNIESVFFFFCFCHTKSHADLCLLMI